MSEAKSYLFGEVNCIGAESTTSDFDYDRNSEILVRRGPHLPPGSFVPVYRCFDKFLPYWVSVMRLCLAFSHWTSICPINRHFSALDTRHDHIFSTDTPGLRVQKQAARIF